MAVALSFRSTANKGSCNDGICMPTGTAGMFNVNNFMMLNRPSKEAQERLLELFCSDESTIYYRIRNNWVYITHVVFAVEKFRVAYFKIACEIAWEHEF